MMVYPDYKKSIYNIIQSIKASYDLEHGVTLNLLDLHLVKDYKNVMILVLDGMGKSIVESTLNKTSWMRQHTSDFITSVYPSTTTAAMTTFYSGKMPIEHGWLGWSLYFKEYCRMIDTFLNTDSYTGELVGTTNAAKTLLDYETVFDQIAYNKKRIVQTYSFNPKGITVTREPTITIHAETFEDMMTSMAKISKVDGHKYMMAYWSDPDHTIHGNGCTSKVVLDVMKHLNEEVEKLASHLEETLLIITADHGLVDIEKTYLINDYNSINECLILPPSIESRCASFFVKDHMKTIFVDEFNKILGCDFKLLTKEAFLLEGFLGTRKAHIKVDDFIGDYVAIATGKSMIGYRTKNVSIISNHKANHAGVLEEEMIVPLIIYTC